MGTSWRGTWVALALAVLTGCGSSGEREPGAPEPPRRVGSTRGGAVVLSSDGRVAVAVNRSASVVSVFRLDPEQPPENVLEVGSRTELDFGAGSEPWAAVIGADDNTAYVVSRRDQRLLRIADLRGSPRLDESGVVSVGSEPTAVAISPSGAYLFVANWAEGTISVVTTEPFVHRSKVDLNAALVETGVLGNQPVRTALAHPRALAITDNGDDSDADETLYATEFFSQPLLDGSAGARADQFDRNRQGLVYVMSVATGRLSPPIRIAPITDTGFRDAPTSVLQAGERLPTACVPNQLYAAAVSRGRLFVSSVCASPAGPLGPAGNGENFKTTTHPVIFQIDTVKNQELYDGHRVLTRELERFYAADAVGEQRMPLIPNDIDFVRGPEPANVDRMLVTSLGADAVFAVEYDGAGFPIGIGEPGRRFIDLFPSGPLRPGHSPIGVATWGKGDGGFALVANDTTQNVSVIDLYELRVAAIESATEGTARAQELLGSSANNGRRSFATGLGVWSLGGQAWNSCEACHPDGLSDGLTWFFSRGPRRTLSTAGSYAGGQRRVMLWTGNIDEVHDVEGIVRTVAGGSGAILWDYSGLPDNALRIAYDGSPIPADVRGPKPASYLLNNLNGSLRGIVEAGRACTSLDRTCDNTLLTDWNDIDAYIQTVRSPRRSTDLVDEEVTAGERLFSQGRCYGCHSGPAWTLSRLFYEPGPLENGAAPYVRPSPPSPEELLGRLRVATYQVPEALRALNPAGASGQATLRRWEPQGGDALLHLYGDPAGDGADRRETAARDQINCVLRAVGTYPPPGGVSPARSVVPSGTTAAWEVRDNMQTPSLGDTGFNTPSLLGLGPGAPYFHAGNARTLEELFDEAFAPHHQALEGGFLSPSRTRTQQVRELVMFLLSIDDDTPAQSIPVSGPEALPYPLNLCEPERPADG